LNMSRKLIFLLTINIHIKNDKENVLDKEI